MNELGNHYPDTDLPEGWMWCRLPDIAEIIMGQSPPSSTYNEQGIGLPFYQGKAEFGELYPTPVKWCCKPMKIAGGNDILISVRAPVGPTNICPEKSCIGRGLAAIRAVPATEFKFIFYYLRNSQETLAAKGTGSTFEAISRSDLEQFDVPLPPLPEQRLIVAWLEVLLERVMKAKEALEKVPQIIKRFRQAVLKKAFSGELTAEWREQQQDLEPGTELLRRIQEDRKHRYEEEVKRAKAEGRRLPKKPRYLERGPLDTSDLPELPDGWVWTRFAFVVKSLKNGIYKQAQFYGSGTPCLRMYNIENAKIVWKNIHFLRLSKDEIEEYGLRPNDILISRVNSRELVGKAAVIPEGLGEVVFESKNIRVRVDPKMVDPRHMVNFLQTAFARDQIEIEAKQTVGMATISQEDILKWLIPLPPIAEQQEIVRRVEALFRFADEVEKRAEEAKKASGEDHSISVGQSLPWRAHR